MKLLYQSKLPERNQDTPNLILTLSSPLPLNTLISAFLASNRKTMDHLVFTRPDVLPKLLHFTSQMQQHCSLWKGYVNFEEIVDLPIWPKI